MADNVLGAWGCPVTPDREAILVLIHIGIGAARHTKILAGHTRGDAQDFISVCRPACLSAERIEKPQPGFVLFESLFNSHPFRRFEYDCHHAYRLSSVVIDWRIVEIH